MKTIFVFLFSFIFTFFWSYVLGKRLFGSRSEEKKDGSNVLVETLIFGLVMALVNSSAVPLAEAGGVCLIGLALAFIIVIVAFLGLNYMFDKEGSKIIELIEALILAAAIAVIGFVVASAWSSAISSAFIKSVLKFIPRGFFIVTLGHCVASFCFFRAKMDKDRIYGYIGKAAIVIAAVVFVIAAVHYIDWGSLGKKVAISTPTLTSPGETGDAQITVPDNKDLEKNVPTQVTLHYAFFNPTLLLDEDESNDFNFGPNPYDTETKEEKDAKWFDANFRSRIAKDPALLAADAAFLDSIVGTRYTGVFYDGAKEDWSQAINDAKVAWIKDKVLYFETLDAFNDFLDTAKKVEVLESDGGETDMMYMNPYTIDGVPDVIVMKTDNHKGHYLVYTFEIKGQEFKVAYRIECGYQPTNVSVRMKIPTVPKPKNPKNPDKPKDPAKDKTKGTQGDLVKPNDDKGPGPDTNNGVGANESKAEEHPNSTDCNNYEEYKKQVEELNNINNNQGNTSNGGTNTNVNVEDNSSNLNTGVNPNNIPLATDANTNSPTTNNSSNASGDYGGPSD